MRETLCAGLAPLHLNLTGAQIDTLCRFGDALLEQNKVMNLTAITDPSAVAQLHFLDCIALTGAANLQNKRLIDVGCGAGFPGVPLKIAEPSLSLTLLDSLGKRTAWLSSLLPQLGIEAEVVTARAEEAVTNRREQYDIATARAVARLPVLCELCLPSVKAGGLFLAMKGASAAEEATESANALRILGGKIRDIYEYPIADAVHRVVVIEKVASTPAKYPRAYAKIKKAPL